MVGPIIVIILMAGFFYLAFVVPSRIHKRHYEKYKGTIKLGNPANFIKDIEQDEE